MTLDCVRSFACLVSCFSRSALAAWTDRLRARRRTRRCASAPTCGSAASRSISRASSAASIPRAVQLVEYPSASEVLRAFRNEAIDGMVISLDELFGLAADGFEPRIVLVVDVSHGADVVVGRGGMRSMRDLKGKSVAVESSALGAFVLSRALALNGMQAADVNVVHLESNEQPSAFEKGEVDGAVTFDPYRARFLQRGRDDAVRQHADPRRDRRPARGARDRHRPRIRRRCRRCSPAGSTRSTTCKQRPEDAARRMGIRQQTTGEQFLETLQGLHIPTREENLRMLGGTTAGARRDGTSPACR